MPDSAFCHLYFSCAGFTVSHHSHQPSFQPLKTKFTLHFREHCKNKQFLRVGGIQNSDHMNSKYKQTKENLLIPW